MVSLITRIFLSRGYINVGLLKWNMYFTMCIQTFQYHTSVVIVQYGGICYKLADVTCIARLSRVFCFGYFTPLSQCGRQRAPSGSMVHELD